MKNDVKRYEAKNWLGSGARTFIDPNQGSKGYERIHKFDRYENDLRDLKAIIDQKLNTNNTIKH